jgi:hypothetical protein
MNVQSPNANDIHSTTDEFARRYMKPDAIPLTAKAQDGRQNSQLAVQQMNTFKF